MYHTRFTNRISGGLIGVQVGSLLFSTYNNSLCCPENSTKGDRKLEYRRAKDKALFQIKSYQNSRLNSINFLSDNGVLCP